MPVGLPPRPPMACFSFEGRRGSLQKARIGRQKGEQLGSLYPGEAQAISPLRRHF